ncbi:cobaltochelatase subunit CobN [Candidatus Poribacteria bacterium]|nr:cobaltochelatase subunit CobN [Candidatus Poribacteria bacterium]
MRREITRAVLATLALASFATHAPCQNTWQPKVGFIGVWDRAVPLIESASQETGVPAAIYRGMDIVKGAQPPAIEKYEVLYLLNIEPSDAPLLKDRFTNALKANPRLKIIPLDYRDAHAELKKAGLLTTDDNAPKYWVANGPINMRRLLNYTSITYLGGKGQIEPPAVVPDFGYYDPEKSEEPFSDITLYRAFKSSQNRWKEGVPIAAILIQQSFWITHDTKVIDAQIRTLEARGVNVVVIFGDTQNRVMGLLKETKPDIIVEDRHGAMWENQALLEEFDVPYLRPVSMLGYTIDEWLKDPRGLSYRDVGMFMTVQESKGTIEPVVVGGLRANLQGFRLHEPIPERVEKFADRGVSWLKLRAKPNSQKRVAIIYYNKGLGKDDLMRGSPTGAFLDGPASLVKFLPRMKESGYAIEPLPKNAKELIEWIRSRGRNIGPWAQGELEECADKANPVMIPLSKYLKWFNEKLSEANRKAVIDHFGPPPGNIMVVERNGEKNIVLPRIELGNVLLAPQPERGEKQDEKLLHSRDVPPPHNYLAFYWWLQEEFKADAIVHWGTHGTVELLPGKEAGLDRESWSDICLGTMPVVNLWIMDNLGEATLSKRRSYALLVDHMVPASVNAGLTDELKLLHDDIDKFDGLEPNLLKEEFRKRITAGARQAGLDRVLKLDPDLSSRSLTDDEIKRLAEYLHQVYNATTPTTLHVLGEPPPSQVLVPYLVSILGRKFLEHLGQVMPVPKEEDRFEGDKYKWLRARGEEFLTSLLIDKKGSPIKLTPELEKNLRFAREMLGRLNRANEEITGLLRGLEGHYIQPGPGPDPIRNPMSAPGGRNLYALNPEEIPTRPSWEIAVKLVDEMLKKRGPKKVGMDLNGMETMRDFGVMEAQILYLMGVRPVWDANNLAIDVELIPREELKRPRIDVFIAMGGMYKENFPTRVELLDKAVRLASAAQEEENSVREGTLKLEQRLISRGFSGEQAAQLAAARIFGTKPGNMSGTNTLYLIPRSGVWNKDDEVADVYIDNMSYVYTKGIWGQKIEGLYENAIQGTDTLVRVWASNMTSQLSNHHAYEYLGGLSMAVKKLTGQEPEALIAKVFTQRDFTGFLGSFFREAEDCFLEQLKLEKLLSDLELEMERRLEKKNIAVKIGPMLGLMGTLIPLGPALTAMAAGDIQQLSSNLVVAFTTTVVGLIIGGICYFISTIQRRWYIHDLNEIEYLIELIYPQESHEI